MTKTMLDVAWRVYRFGQLLLLVVAAVTAVLGLYTIYRYADTKGPEAFYIFYFSLFCGWLSVMVNFFVMGVRKKIWKQP